MSRSMSADMLAAITSNSLLPALFVEAYFATGPVYLWSGIGSISWNSQTWQGIGTMGSVSVIEEGSDVMAKGITLTLSGFDPALLADVLGEVQLGQPVVVYLGMFYSTTPPSLIPSPITAWAGRIDQPTLNVSGEAATIAINCESRLLDMNASVARRYTDADQTIDFPGDRGMEFVSGIVETTIYWGAKPNSANNI